MRTGIGTIVALLLLGALTLHAQTTHWSYGWSRTFMGEKYSQHFSASDAGPYPEWNPGEQVCPLHPTKALLLATQAASNAFAGVKTWELSSLSLQTDSLHGGSGIWFYEVTLCPDLGDENQGSIACVSIVVGLNGYVPEIKKGGADSSGSYAERLKRRREALRKGSGMTEALKQYQMDLRQGKHPLPIPLTPEMDRKLVEEGVLPPLEKDVKKETVQPKPRGDGEPAP